MFKSYEDTKAKFNTKFINYFRSDDLFTQVLNYSIAEGKRIRPIIMLETYTMLTGLDYDNRVLNFAIALELIHNYSLVHDDLPSMDDDDYRRDRLTVHKKYREDLAILAGDGLLNTSFELMLKEIFSSGEIKEMKEACNTAKVIANMAGIEGMILGQVIDVLESSKSSDEMLDMYRKKTCGLIIAATVSAAYLSSSSNETIKDMYELGEAIGLCFQLQDDLLDYEEDKKIGKITFISFEGIDKTKNKIDFLTDKAISILQKYENNKFLTDLVKYLVTREY